MIERYRKGSKLLSHTDLTQPVVIYYIEPNDTPIKRVLCTKVDGLWWPQGLNRATRVLRVFPRLSRVHQGVRFWSFLTLPGANREGKRRCEIVDRIDNLTSHRSQQARESLATKKIKCALFQMQSVNFQMMSHPTILSAQLCAVCELQIHKRNRTSSTRDKSICFIPTPKKVEFKTGW